MSWNFFNLQALNGLNELRKNGVFCDAILRIDDQDFPIHRVVLSSISNYFKALFTVDMAEGKLDRVIKCLNISCCYRMANVF